MEALKESANASQAYAKARVLARRWPKVYEEEESFADVEYAERFNALMDELKKKAGNAAQNVEERKNELIEEAKKILDMGNMRQASDRMKELFEEWRAAGRTTSKEKDDELYEQFSAVRNQFYDKRKEYYDQLNETHAANKAAKQELIEKAREILEMKDMRAAGSKTNQLFEEWKKTGSAGRQNDEALWKEFSGLRKAFYENREKYYAGLKESYAQKAEAKKELIAKIKVYLARGDYSDAIVEEVKGLRKSWKEIGSAGKENEEALWNEFNSLVGKYFEDMKIYK